MTIGGPLGLEQIRELDAEAARHLRQVQHGRVLGAVLDLADVRAVDVTDRGALFLRQVQRPPDRADPRTELLENGMLREGIRACVDHGPGPRSSPGWRADVAGVPTPD